MIPGRKRLKKNEYLKEDFGVGEISEKRRSLCSNEY
jgi:hypothetical protein